MSSSPDGPVDVPGTRGEARVKVEFLHQAIVSKHIDRFVAELREKCSAMEATSWLESALRAVPRHLFIERFADEVNPNDPWAPVGWVSVDQLNPSREALDAIYSDRGLMLKSPPDHSAASQPVLVLMMLHELGLEPGMKVLEIGTGSGWNAGLITHGVGRDELVHSMDIQHELVEQARGHLTAAGHPGVKLAAGDAGLGWPDGTSFDRIVATVGCPDIPPAWLDQLADDGILLVPLLMRGFGAPRLRLRKHGATFAGGFRGDSGFMTLQGSHHTDVHDRLEVDRIPEGGPVRSVSLPEGIVFDFLTFLFSTNDAFRYAVRRTESTPFILYHVDSGSWITFMPDDPKVDVLGRSSAFDDLRAAQEAWIAHRRPSLTSFEIEVVAAGSPPARGWLDARRSLTLRYRLAAEERT